MHIRLCALHAISYYYYVHKQQMSMPGWLLSIGSRIPLQYLGHSTRTDALSRALQTAASLEHGVTPLGWLDIVLQVKAGNEGDEFFGQQLQAKVLAIAPEFGRKITSWQHMGALCNRVAGEVWSDAERVLSENGVPKSVIPQSHFREAWFLQPSSQRKMTPQKEKGLQPLEQVCAGRRFLTDIVRAWQAAGGSATKDGIGKVAKEDDLKKYASLAKKFVVGMESQEHATHISVRDCLEDFATGNCDGFLHQARDTTMAALLAVISWSDE